MASAVTYKNLERFLHKYIYMLVNVVSVVCADVIVILSLSVSVWGVWKVAACWTKVETGEGRSGLEVIGALLIG